MNKIIKCFMITLIWYSSANADVFDHPLTDIAVAKQIVQNPPTISGKFKQNKEMTSLGVTLKSAGEFAIDKKTGILWRNIEPISSITIIQKDKICFGNGTGKQTDISTSDNKALQNILTLINSIFAQNYEEIAKYFDVYFINNGKNYTIGLKAKDSAVSQIMETMIVHGDKYIRSIEFSDTFKDKTNITFTNIIENAQKFNCN